jgi:uncharacterized protein
MAHSPFRFDLHNLPSDGKQLAGTLPHSFFDLDPKDIVQATGPMNYEIEVMRDEDDLILTGKLDATFELECGRCLGRFAYEVEIDEYQGEVTIEDVNAAMIDLTDVIRDDILVALPSYPRCEDGNVDPRECPAQGKFDTVATSDSAEGQAPGDAAWDVLEQLKNR